MIQAIQQGAAVGHLLVLITHHIGQEAMDAQLLTLLVREGQTLEGRGLRV